MRKILFTLCAFGIMTTTYSQNTAYSNTKITLTAKRDNNYDIYVMNPDGSMQKRLTHNPDWDEQPCWSPDGKKIIYQRVINNEDDSGYYYELYFHCS